MNTRFPALLLPLVFVATPPAHARWLKARAMACVAFLSKVQSRTPRPLLERLVAIRNLPTGFGFLTSRRKGFARVTKQEGSTLTLEFFDERTMRPRSLRVDVNDVRAANPVDRWLFERTLRQAAMRAGRPDPTLTGKTVRLDQFDPPLAYVVGATTGELHVRVVDAPARRTYALTVERPVELPEVTGKPANVFANLLKITDLLERHPGLREGQYVLWSPNVPVNADPIPEAVYGTMDLFHDDLQFPFERPFGLPDVPSIRVPLLYQRRPVPMRIDRLSLEQGLVYVSGKDWSGTLRLSPDLLTKSAFVTDPFAAFYVMPTRGFESFDEFRVAFANQTLAAGQAVIEFTQQPNGVAAPVESPAFDVYRVVYADDAEVILKNPERTVHYRTADELGRLATSSRMLGQDAEATYVKRFGGAEIFADGAFVPSARDVARFEFLKEIRSIRADLKTLGLTTEVIDHFAVHVTREDAAKNLKDFFPAEWPWKRLLRVMHPDQSHFNPFSPATRKFAEEVFKLARLARDRAN